MNDTTIGQRISEERKKLGLSQEALGEKMGVSRQAISKWEADAAVPEIDKLIALSKLFGVSVGWLLGVEEQPEKQPDELNETQLKMVEEIVRRYQPQTDIQKPNRPWYIPVLICITGIVGILAVTDMSTRSSTPGPDYSQQISNLENNYSSIQSQLSSLDDRLNEIAEAAQEPSLLLSYEMVLTGITPGSSESEVIKTGPNTSDIIVDLPTATLSFTAVPQQYGESDTAYLSVLLGSSEVKRVECQRQGAGCSAELTLPLSDGYEYCFVLRSGDGTEQAQILDLPEFSQLYTNNTLRCEVTSEPAIGYNGSTLEFDDMIVTASMPYWLSMTEPLYWEDYGFILYENGEEVERRSLLDLGMVDRNSTNFSASYLGICFYGIALTEGETIELRFYAKLDNGMECDTLAGYWVMQSGEPVETAQPDEF